MSDEPKPNWKAFGKAIMEVWPEYDVDGGYLQDMAEKHHIILKVPGGFDPEIHEVIYGCEEPNCKWYLRNY